MIVTALTKLDGFTKHNQILARDFPRELADFPKTGFRDEAAADQHCLSIVFLKWFHHIS